MIDWNYVISSNLLSFLSSISLVNFHCKLLDIFNIEIGNRLLSFTLSELCQTSYSNQEGCLADSFLMLFWKELQEISNCCWAIKGFFESHFVNLNIWIVQISKCAKSRGFGVLGFWKKKNWQNHENPCWISTLFLSEVAEASLCYFFENWWMKLKCHNLRNTQIPSNKI